ncbi:chromatin assembly factor 1 subunit A-like [Littorina saxatilis]|uniref:Chromatin assembly factor 1 subunit A n=1 Tax=Littorina saxatilis TaxID=31220 RepID=A0AAN9GNS4_9CAEN
MAQCVVGGEKRPIVGDKDVIDVDMQPNKRLKQVRLPFKPLDCKPPTPSPVANNSASKKRKSSGPDSPTAKPKLSKLPDLRSSAEKIRPAKSKNDNEVSSSSEAESLPASGSKSRSTSNNILEKFVRRENEISSTNDVIDLTGSVVLEENEENSPAKVMSPKKPKAKLPSETNTKEEQTPAAEANPGEKGSCSDQTASSAESNTNEKPEDHFVRKLVFDSEKTGDDCKTTVPEDKDSSENLSLKEDNEESMQEDVEAEAEGHQDEGDTSQNDETPDESIVIKTDSDDESSQSQKEEEEESSSKTPVSKKKPRCTSTPQTRGSANTSCSSVEGATPTSENKAKRPLSKKQAERAAMREKVKQEKERQKQEAKEQKEKERLENKKQRDEEKAEKEKAKMEEKEKKEKERQEKKEQLEKEKQDKLKQKEEERKKKQEMLDAKEEERKQKEEEKRLKEEQKLKEEEEKQKLAEKRKAAFTSFFTKPTVVTSTKVDKAAEKNLFIPFEVKKDMTLAPVTRQVLSDDDRQCLDEALSKIEETGVTYLTQLRQGAKKPVRTNRVLRNKVETEEDVELLVHDSEAVKKSTHAVKLLQFHTDYRPPYYGTWHKKMAGLSPRNPWKKYEDVFDYEVNSDEEWEEEEPGESLSDSNGEEDEGEAEEDEVDEDDWMVPHGYLSADEGCDDDEEVTPEVLKARQRAKAQAWETELTAKRRVAPPVHIGCHWLDSPCSNAKHLDVLRQFEMMFLRTSPVETLVSNPDMLENGDKNDSFASKNTSGSKCFRKRALPEEAMPDLIRLLHGNSLGIKKMVREFRLYWRQKSSDLSTSLNESKLEDEPETQEKSLMETGVAGKLGEKSSGACTVPGDDAGKTKQEGSPGKTQNDSVLNEDANDCCVSKRQLEIKIMAIAAREKREGTKRPCWYVKSDVLQQYNMADLPMENSWVYISIDMTKKTPNKPAAESKNPNKSAAEKKTPNKSASNKKKTNKSSAEKKTPRKQGAEKSSQDPDEKTGSNSDALVTPHKGKGSAESNGTPKTEKNTKEASAKKKPKDQPSIMAFAKKTPSKPTPVKKEQTKEVREASNVTGEVIDVDMEESAQAKSSPANVPSEEQKKASEIEKPSSKMDEDCIVLD